MSKTFAAIHKIVLQQKLNGKGFRQKDIISHLPKDIPHNTVNTFIWKHAIGGGEVPNLYFRKLSSGKYMITQEFYN